MLNVIYAECHYAEYHYTECRYAECHAECRYAECPYAVCACMWVFFWGGGAVLVVCVPFFKFKYVSKFFNKFFKVKN
jgi:hypothetical protein